MLCTIHAVAGISLSGERVATMIRSTSSGETPPISRAFLAASAQKSEVVSCSSAIRRSLIPVLETIHSSEVSTIFSMSLLVTTREGTPDSSSEGGATGDTADGNDVGGTPAGDTATGDTSTDGTSADGAAGDAPSGDGDTGDAADTNVSGDEEEAAAGSAGGTDANGETTPEGDAPEGNPMLD